MSGVRRGRVDERVLGQKPLAAGVGGDEFQTLHARGEGAEAIDPLDEHDFLRRRVQRDVRQAVFFASGGVARDEVDARGAAERARSDAEGLHLRAGDVEDDLRRARAADPRRGR